MISKRAESERDGTDRASIRTCFSSRPSFSACQVDVSVQPTFQSGVAVWSAAFGTSGAVRALDCRPVAHLEAASILRNCGGAQGPLPADWSGSSPNLVSLIQSQPAPGQTGAWVRTVAWAIFAVRSVESWRSRAHRRTTRRAACKPVWPEAWGAVAADSGVPLPAS